MCVYLGECVHVCLSVFHYLLRGGRQNACDHGVHVCLCVCVCVCVCISACVCVCVSVCLCVGVYPVHTFLSKSCYIVTMVLSECMCVLVFVCVCVCVCVCM